MAFLAFVRGFLIDGVWLGVGTVATVLPIIFLFYVVMAAVQGSGNTIADGIGQVFQPILGPIGMNPALTVSLFFGFIAKEILLGAMAVIHATSDGDLGGVISQAISPLPALAPQGWALNHSGRAS